MVPSVSRRLSQFVSSLRYEDLPRELIDKVKTLVLHGIGVSLASYDTQTAQVAIEVARKEQKGKSTIILGGGKVLESAAAFSNAVLFHSRAQEDDYIRGNIHPGVVILPATLAVAENLGTSGKEIIAAIAAGYEVAVRLSKDFSRLIVARGFRSTTVFGPPGVAAAVGKLYGLSEDRMVLAIGWSANLSSGLMHCAVAKTPEMPIQAGIASRNGIMAARLGKAGVAVSENIFEGERGLYTSFAGVSPDFTANLIGLGEEYQMMDTFLKRFPVGGGVQGTVSATLDLIKDRDIVPEDVESIQVKLPVSHARYPGIDSLEPGLINARYCISVALVHKKVTLRTIADLNNQKVKALMPKITVVPDDTLSSPGCRLSVVLKNGEVLTKDYPVTHKDYLFTFDQECEYIRSLIPEMALARSKVERMIDLIAAMEDWESVDELMKTISHASRKGERLLLPF